MLRLLPLPHDTLRGTLTGSASAANVLTASPARPLEEAEVVDILIGRHDLTPMEAAVTVQIAKGDGRAAAAERLGIRENTVRTHLSAIFLKLGLNRQAQRVQFVTGLSRDE
jgi:DNA-binding CsgD family transcriptional regulator